MEGIIVFDCDGVICDFVKGFYLWYYDNKYNEIHGDIPKNPSNWNFNWSGDIKIIHQLISDFIKTKPILELMCEKIPTVMCTLKNKYEINIVSHYPDHETRVSNLNKIGIIEGIHYDKLYCLNTQTEKIEAIRMMKPLHYIEDAPHIVDLIAGLNLPINIYIPSNYKYSDGYANVESKGVKINRYTCSDELLYLIT